MTQQRAGQRRAYTLIELLVVLAIIAILMGLTTAAVMRARGRGPQVQARTELAQLEVALANCCADRGLSAVPSRLVLREDGQYLSSGPNQAAYSRTVAVLQKMFGRHFKVTGRYDWNGDGVIGPGETVLEGQHCLVFFLGGIPAPPSDGTGCTGFNTDAQNPAAPGGTRAGPYYEFKASRLRRDNAAGGFLVYLDPWLQQPYAYFSATKAGNDYSADCRSLGVEPYFASGKRFINPTGCQILSAGPDTSFGRGGLWDPARGAGPGDGADDFSNFSRAALGAPQQ